VAGLDAPKGLTNPFEGGRESTQPEGDLRAEGKKELPVFARQAPLLRPRRPIRLGVAATDHQGAKSMQERVFGLRRVLGEGHVVWAFLGGFRGWSRL